MRRRSPAVVLFVSGCLRRSGRLGSDCAYRAEECRINCPAQKEDFSTNLLYETFARFVQCRSSGFLCHILFLGSVLDACTWIRCILLSGWFDVLELLERLGDVAWHGQVYLAAFVISIDGDAHVPFGHLVMLFQCLLEM